MLLFFFKDLSTKLDVLEAPADSSLLMFLCECVCAFGSHRLHMWRPDVTAVVFLFTLLSDAESH